MKTACLLYKTNDKPGIVAALSNFLFSHGININTLEQHAEDGMFFTRISWEDLENWQTENEFKKDFQLIINKFSGEVEVHFFSKIQKLGLFASKELQTLLEILAKIEVGEFQNVEIPFIVSNYTNAQPVAERHNIPFYHVPTKIGSFDHEAPQLEIIKKYKPDFIGLARYMKVLSADFINGAECPIINIHHSFLPAFIGARPYEMAYERGVKIIGATSHFVTPVLDDGPIIEQGVTRVRSGMSVEQIKMMGSNIEKKVFANALSKVLDHKVLLHEKRTVVFE